MSNYQCPDCGCDEFLLLSKVKTLNHLEKVEFCSHTEIVRTDKGNHQDSEVEFAQCRNCAREITYGVQE